MKKTKQRQSKQLLVTKEKVVELQPTQLEAVAGGMCTKSWGVSGTLSHG